MEALKNRVSSDIYLKLLYANIDSPKQILMKNPRKLQQITKLNAIETDNVRKEAARCIMKSDFCTALEIPRWQRLSTGCQILDSLLRGGIPVKGITEIFGPSGVGKTQLCLQLALMVQFPECFGGLNQGAVYICTEDKFPSRRLHELVNMFPSRFNMVDQHTHKFEDNIYLKHLADFEQLRRCLYVELPNLLSKRKIGLIIIDSIAGLFRSENNCTSYINRSLDFTTIASKLYELGENYQFSIICLNQVTNNLDLNKTLPCLGLSWSTYVTCRFSMSRVNERIRELKVIFSPDLPENSCNFVIQQDGLHGVK